MPERATPGRHRRSEKSAEAVVVTRESDEGLNGGKSEALVSLVGAMRRSPDGGIRKRALRRRKRGYPRSRRDLNPPNRRMRTGMSGGVAGGHPLCRLGRRRNSRRVEARGPIADTRAGVEEV